MFKLAPCPNRKAAASKSLSVVEAKVKEVETVEEENKPKISIGKILEKDVKESCGKSHDKKPKITTKKKKPKSKFGKKLEG